MMLSKSKSRNPTHLKKVYVHPRALVESRKIGKGTRIWAFAHVMKDAKIGSGCNICDHAFIESNAIIGDGVTIKNGVSVWDGVQIEDNVFVGPNAVFTNDPNPRAEIKKPREEWLPTIIRRGATIGANATVVCGITIGSYAFVAAGAVVTRSVPSHALIVGVPGRVKGWMCRCGNRIRVVGERGRCGACNLCYSMRADGMREESKRKRLG